MHNVKNKQDIDLRQYQPATDDHAYVEDLSEVAPDDAAAFLQVGIETRLDGRSGTFIQKDNSVIHCNTTARGVEIRGINQAQEKYDGLKDYIWKSISPDNDQYTARTYEKPNQGYFIRTLPGAKIVHPVQSCLHISRENTSQHVHNIVVAEEKSEIHIITGCSTSEGLTSGLHVGVSEFYVKKGAILKFTMIHDWGEKINVRPRTVTHVEEGGVLISNYISLKPVGSLQMNPVTYLDGKGAIARFNSVLVADANSYMDVGSTVILNGVESRAEIISRAITTGGTIIARGKLVGNVPSIKAHLECKGLILNEGLLHAIPELQGSLPGVEMSHEAAVGKIDQREIEYLMSRGLDEDEAVSTIVRGFLNVDIEGLPAGLVEKLDQAIADTQEDMM
jgi:hypothetical protein